MSDADPLIDEDEARFAESIPSSVRLTRRALLKRTAALAAAWTVCPWPISVPDAYGQTIDRTSITQTLEAFADTLIPGEKRAPDDRAIAGVMSGAGAVQAGALRMMNHPAVGFQQGLSTVAFLLNLRAVGYALRRRITLTLTVPPFVELDFASRTSLLVDILDGNGPDQGLFSALASLAFVAYHTAGYMPTVEAIRAGHPGLAAIRFPAPDADGLWRFPNCSYGRALGTPHPDSKHGNPA